MVEKQTMDLVKINYTGSLPEGPVFDTTEKEVAEKEGIYDDKRVYKPMTVAVGEGQVIKGLDEELAKMKVGEEKEVNIPQDKAYGPRDSSKVSLVPRKIFKKEKINPFPGMPVEIDGMHGRVQTVSGGRIRVDFNHELAGKDLVFNVKIEEKATTDTQKAEYLVEKSFNSLEGFKVDYKSKKMTVELPQSAYSDRNLLMRKATLAGDAFRLLKASKVEYTEVWENPEGEKKDEKKKPKKESEAKEKTEKEPGENEKSKNKE